MALPKNELDKIGDSLTPSLNSLNEQTYINKLYAENDEADKKLIQQNFTDNTGILDREQKRAQNQSDDYTTRTNVEAKSGTQNVYNGPKLSAGINPQAALVQENSLRRNTGQLDRGLQEIQQEFDRQRQLIAKQFEADIKAAQANNDMQKAQALYDAARKEDQQLLELMQKEMQLYSSYGDTERSDAIMQQFITGGVPAATYEGTTSPDVLRYEDNIRKMFDSQSEAEMLALRAQLDENLSDIQAKREAEERQTDEKLTDTYVKALQKARNYAEVQNAYGMGSGSFGQAQLAQDTELQKALTDLRLLQMNTDAMYGQQELDAYRDFSKNAQQRQADINLKRAQELVNAAEGQEEQQAALAELLLQFKLLNERGGGGGGGYGYGGGGSSGDGGGTDMPLGDTINIIAANSNTLSSSGAMDAKNNVNKAINNAVANGELTPEEAAQMKSDLRGQIM